MTRAAGLSLVLVSILGGMLFLRDGLMTLTSRVVRQVQLRTGSRFVLVGRQLEVGLPVRLAETEEAMGPIERIFWNGQGFFQAPSGLHLRVPKEAEVEPTTFFDLFRLKFGRDWENSP